MIDPGTAPDGEAYLAYCRRRWGGDGWTEPMKRMGRKEGAPYANWRTWPNTTHCSRLLMLAEQHDLGEAVIGMLYRACYEEGENVSLRETVARVAREAGVPGGQEYVQSDAGTQELKQALNRSIVNGKRVSAAPTFSLRIGQASGPSFSGARESDEWLHILTQCAAKAK